MFLLGVAFLAAAHQIGFTDLGRLYKGVSNLGLLANDLLPPNPEAFLPALDALVETVQMAFVGTVIGFFLSLPAATLALRTIFPSYVTTAVRAFLGLVRTIPVLFWAVIFVIAVGLGPLAGTLALSVYSLGYLSKLYFEAFEAVDQDVLDALRCTGASRLALVRYAVIPESMNTLISQLLFMLEYNIRSSAVLGFVGAGGVGFLMTSYIETLQYNSLTTVIAMTLALVISIDFLSGYVRKKFLPEIRMVKLKR
ncbi:MAG: phosphonate ABC transporter, permease protein PhnE [Candidatus Caldarchaeum sp.]